MPDPVILTVGGLEHRGWTAVEVRLSVERLAGQFTLTLADAWTEAGRIVRGSVRPGQRCTVSLGGETVITGWIDKVTASVAAEQHVIQVEGRDATGDLVDCSADRHEWQGATAPAIIGDLSRPFGVGVVMEGDPGRPFARFAVNVGDTIAQAVERIARARGFAAHADGLGNLVLAERIAARAPVRLRLADMVSAEAEHDHTDRHSALTVKTTREGADGLTADEIARVEATLADSDIARHRPKVVIAEVQIDGPTVADRARHGLRTARARSRSLRFAVPGWGHPAGGLWRPGRGVTVEDERGWLDLGSETLVIAEAAYTRSGDSGTLCRMTARPPEAFDVLAVPSGENG